jgi:hypothetical protein
MMMIEVFLKKKKEEVKLEDDINDDDVNKNN